MGRKRTVALVVLALVDGVGAWWWSGQKRGASQPARRRSNPRSVVPRAIGQGRLIGWWPAAPDQLGVAAPVTSSDSTSNIHPTDYVGPERCRKCHQRNHEDWRQHAHRLMNAVANQETVRGDFSGRATLHQDGGRVTVFEDPTRAPGFAPRSPHLRAETGGRQIASGRNQTNLNWACGRCHAGSRSEFAAGMGTWNSIEYTDATRGACCSQLKCVDCHDPHKAIGQKWTRTRAQDESVCLKCQQEFVSRDVRRQHTHHEAGAPGDGCLECHMPRINEGLQDIVRRHSIFSPTHGEMLEANHPNACNLCHVEERINWTVDWLRKWCEVEVDSLDLDRAYVDKSKSVGEGWLESEIDAVRLVCADAVVRHRAVWSLEFLVARLDDEFLINRQFSARGLEKMLGLDLFELGYRFHESRSERKRGVKRVRELVLGSDSVVAGAGGR